MQQQSLSQQNFPSLRTLPCQYFLIKLRSLSFIQASFFKKQIIAKLYFQFHERKQPRERKKLAYQVMKIFINKIFFKSVFQEAFDPKKKLWRQIIDHLTDKNQKILYKVNSESKKLNEIMGQSYDFQVGSHNKMRTQLFTSCEIKQNPYRFRHACMASLNTLGKSQIFVRQLQSYKNLKSDFCCKKLIEETILQIQEDNLIFQIQKNPVKESNQELHRSFLFKISLKQKNYSNTEVFLLKQTPQLIPMLYNNLPIFIDKLFLPQIQARRKIMIKESLKNVDERFINMQSVSLDGIDILWF